MLHKLKVALHAHKRNVPRQSDARLRDADEEIRSMQEWIPEMRKQLDENEKLWDDIGRNMCAVGSTAKQACFLGHGSGSRSVADAADALVAAGDSARRIRFQLPLQASRARVRSALHKLSDAVRDVANLHTECARVAREREYYCDKASALRVEDVASTTGATVGWGSGEVAERRERNERKHSMCCERVDLLLEGLARALDDIAEQRERVAGAAVRAYVEAQGALLSSEVMAPVLGVMGRERGRRRRSAYAEAAAVAADKAERGGAARSNAGPLEDSDEETDAEFVRAQASGSTVRGAEGRFGRGWSGEEEVQSAHAGRKARSSRAPRGRLSDHNLSTLFSRVTSSGERAV